MLLRRVALRRSIPRRVEPCTRQPLLRVVLDNPPPTNIGRNRKRGIAGARARANPLFSAAYMCVCVCHACVVGILMGREASLGRVAVVTRRSWQRLLAGMRAPRFCRSLPSR